MRGRFYRSEDEQILRDWLNTDARLELEIGSGKGLFLMNQSPQHQETRYIGLELAAKYAWECQAKVEKADLKNLRFFACDAVAVIDRDVQTDSIDAVHVYFPDPWWKAKHKKRRVLNEDSLRNIERILKPNGELHFWTDVLDYYELTLELIDQVTRLEGPLFVSEPASTHDMDYRTHFERRTRRNGLPVYRSRFIKSV
ncbi:tRNA (guanine-N(7)-)-methyltransferase [Pirellula sp. SH-Sr6A]|nr:tRNA (guanine-N(7)-)-methyltransferase [Pirellula sp. SH-Sr6A]